VTTTKHLVSAGLRLGIFWPEEPTLIVRKKVATTGWEHFTCVGVVRPAACVFRPLCAPIGGGGERAGPLEEEQRRQ